jgi:hypothetical protein
MKLWNCYGQVVNLRKNQGRISWGIHGLPKVSLLSMARHALPLYALQATTPKMA